MPANLRFKYNKGNNQRDGLTNRLFFSFLHNTMPLPFPFACPYCHTTLDLIAIDELRCPNDGLRFPCVDGVWRFLLPERATYFAPFIRDYETVRRAEGRSGDPADYRALPYLDLTGKNAPDWRIRAASFEAFFAQVVRPLERPGAALTALDLGAGNGWLSNRLASRGHRLTAVDLTVNDFDGLGCRRYYETAFTPAQAEFERLPFHDGCADLAIFNASLHYAVDVRAALTEALRALKTDGELVILDSPFYHDPTSGAQMVREREESFLRQYGFRSNMLPSKNYLTYNELKDLGAALGVRWQILTPFYGLSWLLKPLKASLLRRREPAKFHVIVGRR